MNNNFLEFKAACDTFLAALKKATDCGLLDSMTEDFNPDEINIMCDMVGDIACMSDDRH